MFRCRKHLNIQLQKTHPRLRKTSRALCTVKVCISVWKCLLKYGWLLLQRRARVTTKARSAPSSRSRVDATMRQSRTQAIVCAHARSVVSIDLHIGKHFSNYIESIFVKCSTATAHRARRIVLICLNLFPYCRGINNHVGRASGYDMRIREEFPYITRGGPSQHGLIIAMCGCRV